MHWDRFDVRDLSSTMSRRHQFEMMNFKYRKCTTVKSYKPVPDININDIEEAAEIINKSKKPITSLDPKMS